MFYNSVNSLNMPAAHIWRSFVRGSLIAAVLLISALLTMPASFAQDSAPLVSAPENITLSTIERAKEKIANNTDLNETQIAAAQAAYDTAETAFTNAQANLEDAKQLNGIISALFAPSCLICARN